MMSASSSIPTDRRIKLSAIPSFSRSFGGTDAWVITELLKLTEKQSFQVMVYTAMFKKEMLNFVYLSAFE